MNTLNLVKNIKNGKYFSLNTRIVFISKNLRKDQRDIRKDYWAIKPLQNPNILGNQYSKYNTS